MALYIQINRINIPYYSQRLYTSTDYDIMKYLIYFSLIAGVICGFTFPQLRILMPYLPCFVAFMLLFNFIDTTMQYKNLLWPELIVTFLLTVVIMPLLSYYLLSLPFHEHY